jgi:hypothetical protein
VPVLLGAHGIANHAEAGQLRSLAQAALEFRETGEGRERNHVVPELDGVFFGGQPADHGAEERGPAGRLEVQDRGADITAGQCERLVSLYADLVVQPRIVQSVGKGGRQAKGLQHRL